MIIVIKSMFYDITPPPPYESIFTTVVGAAKFIQLDCIFSSSISVYFNNPDLPDDIEKSLRDKDEKHYDMKVLRHISHNNNS